MPRISPPTGAQPRTRAARPSPCPRASSRATSRARASAAILAGAFGLAVTHDAQLREMDFGAWDGRPWAELEAADGARLARWMGDWAVEATPGGEAFPDVAARTAAWLAELRAGAAPGETVLAVAHAGPIRTLLCEAMGWPLGAAFRVRMDQACVAAVRLPEAGEEGRGGAELLVLNADRVPRTV